jgi:Family of unknown function (DUF5565)
MKKIPTLFERSDERGRVLPVVNPECQWVLDGEGVATRKFDGTCVMLDKDAKWWARREVKPGKQPPPGFMEEQHDEVTGKTVGWEPAEQSSFWKYIVEALNVAGYLPFAGTHELCGPKINGNPERFDHHILVPHGAELLYLTPRDYEGLREWMRNTPYEGIVWYHPDGRRAKLKRRDFPVERVGRDG